LGLKSVTRAHFAPFVSSNRKSKIKILKSLLAIFLAGCSHGPPAEICFSPLPPPHFDPPDIPEPPLLIPRYPPEPGQVVNLRQSVVDIVQLVTNRWNVIDGYPELDNFEELSNFWARIGIESFYLDNRIFFREKR
jgi:hypothetical protein